jgi:hypothetical chaperone protein
MTSSYSCGIDFGTSNSVCALSDGKAAQLVAVEAEKETLPSAIFFADEGDLSFGRAAVRSYIEGEDGRLMRSLKSVLGTSLMQEKTLIRRRSVPFTDILALLLRHLKGKIDTKAGADVTSVVMGRPVHFHDGNEKADKESEDTLRSIAQNIGFKDIHFQFEPIAAAYAHEQNLSGEKLALVIDLGGGTSDFTVMRLSPDHVLKADRSSDILATGGVRVGGTNFDTALSLKTYMPYLGMGSTYRDTFEQSKILPMPTAVYHDLSEWPKVHHAQNKHAILQTKEVLRLADEKDKVERLLAVQENALGHALLQSIEEAKITLSAQHSVNAAFDELGVMLSHDVTRADFEMAIDVLLTRTRKALEECLKDAGVSGADIDLAILTGGSAQLPVVQDLVKSLFPTAELSSENTFSSVGLGLGIQARAIFA